MSMVRLRRTPRGHEAPSSACRSRAYREHDGGRGAVKRSSSARDETRAEALQTQRKRDRTAGTRTSRPRSVDGRAARRARAGCEANGRRRDHGVRRYVIDEDPRVAGFVHGHSYRAGATRPSFRSARVRFLFRLARASGRARSGRLGGDAARCSARRCDQTGTQRHADTRRQEPSGCQEQHE